MDTVDICVTTWQIKLSTFSARNSLIYTLQGVFTCAALDNCIFFDIFIMTLPSLRAIFIQNVSRLIIRFT
jgi:hypothetical protein